MCRMTFVLKIAIASMQKITADTVPARLKVFVIRCLWSRNGVSSVIIMHSLGTWPSSLWPYHVFKPSDARRGGWVSLNGQTHREYILNCYNFNLHLLYKVFKIKSSIHSNAFLCQQASHAPCRVNISEKLLICNH